jgi:hypothetical protein
LPSTNGSRQTSSRRKEKEAVQEPRFLFYKFFLQQRRNTSVEYSLSLCSHARESAKNSFPSAHSHRRFVHLFASPISSISDQMTLWALFLPVENTGVVAEWEQLPSLPPQKPLVLPSPSIAATTETAATSATQPIAAQPTLSAKPTCLYLVRIPLFKAPAEAIGVVDTDQVFAAHPLTSDSPEARANAISEIQRATAVCARAHQYGVVLDISQNSIEGYLSC